MLFQKKKVNFWDTQFLNNYYIFIFQILFNHIKVKKLNIKLYYHQIKLMSSLLQDNL